jgi:hypothetical protein
MQTEKFVHSYTRITRMVQLYRGGSFSLPRHPRSPCVPLHAGIKAHLVAPVAWRVLPPKQLQKVAFVAPPILTKDMKSPRPKRLRRDKVPWEATVAFTLNVTKKAERKAPRISKTKALKPIPLEPLPLLIERPLPYYTP